METLAGKVAVVTGAASGIGFGIASRLAARGTEVLLADVEAPALGRAVDALRASGATASAHQVDVSDASAVTALAETVVRECGAVHVVCNNAGVQLTGRVWQHTLDEWRWLLGVNFWGVLHGMRAFVPYLLEQDEGHVVNTSSMAGLTVGTGNGAYAASKHAVLAVSEALALDLADLGSNVGVSVYCPGYVRTRILDSGRNRPADMPAPVVADEVLAAKRTRMTTGIESGIDPSQAGELVASAIEDGRYWVFNDTAALDRITARHGAIVRGDPPSAAGADQPGSARR